MMLGHVEGLLQAEQVHKCLALKAVETWCFWWAGQGIVCGMVAGVAGGMAGWRGGRWVEKGVALWQLWFKRGQCLGPGEDAWHAFLQAYLEQGAFWGVG